MSSKNCQSIYDQKAQLSFDFESKLLKILCGTKIEDEKEPIITFGTPVYTFSPLGWLMIIPGLGFRMLWAISSYMNTTIFSSFTPPFRRI